MKKLFYGILFLTLLGCGQGNKFEIEVTYIDGTTEKLIVTQIEPIGSNIQQYYLQNLDNTCTHKYFSPSRCHVRKVKLLKSLQ